MSAETEHHYHSGRVTELKRIQPSRDGNPRWRVNLDDGTTFSTEPDAVVGYAISVTEHENHWVKLELNGEDRIVGIEVLGKANMPKLPQKLSAAEKMAMEIRELWDARTSQGLPFLNVQQDVQPMRDILEKQHAPELRAAMTDAVTEALTDAAEAFPSDIPGQSLVKEWLEERAAKYRSGELDVL